MERFCSAAINFCKKKPKYKMKSFYNYIALDLQSDKGLKGDYIVDIDTKR